MKITTNRKNKKVAMFVKLLFIRMALKLMMENSMTSMILKTKIL